MPLFEYACRTCEHQFEALVRASGDTPACPSCHGTELQRRLSTFAARTGGLAEPMPAASACGRCGDPRGPGACSMN